MSTKTNFKRVALVAVASLGLGVLTSVAPASAAGTAVVRADFQYLNGSSFGVCAAATDRAVGGAYSTATLANAGQVGEILSNGSVVFADATDASTVDLYETITVSVTGPASITAVDQTSMTTSLVYGAAGSSITAVGTNATPQVPFEGFTVTANGAGTIQVTVSTMNDSYVSSTIEIYTFVAGASCVTGNASVANSIVKVDLYDADPTAAESTTNITTSVVAGTVTKASAGVYGGGSLAVSADKIANGGAGYIDLVVNDGTIAATTLNSPSSGIFTASATNGAVLFWVSGTGTTSATNQTSSATVTLTGEKFNRLVVTQGLANKNKPMSTVVSMYYNGVLYGTRTINFTGKASAIAISAADSVVGTVGTSMAVGNYEITDSAGNKLTSAGPGTGVDGTSLTNAPILATAGVVVDTVSQSTVTQVDLSTSYSDPYDADSGMAGYFGWTCGSGKSGTAKVYLKHTFSDLTSLVSNQYDAACAQDPKNYKASLDKATYAPGDLATLTITATDKTGAAVWDADIAGDALALGDTGYDVSIYLPMLTAITAPTNSDYFSGGKKTYKFSVGATEGSYNGVVNLPVYNSTTYSQSALTLPFTIKSSSTAVTNADVLKAIVSLIASINKQIAALQKALLKK